MGFLFSASSRQFFFFIAEIGRDDMKRPPRVSTVLSALLLFSLAIVSIPVSAVPRGISGKYNATTVRHVEIPPLETVPSAHEVDPSLTSKNDATDSAIKGYGGSSPGLPMPQESLILATDEYEASGAIYDQILSRLSQQQNALERQQDRLRLLRSQADQSVLSNRMVLPSATELRSTRKPIVSGELRFEWDPRYPLSIVLSFQPRDLWAIVDDLYPTASGYSRTAGSGRNCKRFIWLRRLFGGIFCGGSLPRTKSSMLVGDIAPRPVPILRRSDHAAPVIGENGGAIEKSTRARRFQLKLSIWRPSSASLREWIRTISYPPVDLLKSDDDKVEIIVPFASGDWGAVKPDDLWMLRISLLADGVETSEGLPIYQFKFNPVLPPSDAANFD